MITVCRSNGEALEIKPGDSITELGRDIVWIDMLSPQPGEELIVETFLGIAIPTREELKDIEPSSRLYMDGNTAFMTASLVWKAESDLPELTDVAFILAGNTLLTVRYAEPRAFQLFRAAIHRIPGGCSSGAILAARLFETIIDRTAEILEQAVMKIDRLSVQVFAGKTRKRRPPHYLEGRLLDVAGYQRLVAKTRDSLMSLSRVMIFLNTIPAVKADKDVRGLCRTISRDIQSLSEHAAFISGNINFLLDASLGLIGVEQNAIIKIFSIASVVFLPPTLVASIYGMNFNFMPELKWLYGYPASLGIMIMSAIIPFFFFRWKGWL